MTPVADWLRLRRLGVWWLVAVLAGVGLAVAAYGQIRVGGYLMAFAFVLGGLIRWVSPKHSGLGVRRRWVDALCLIGLGLALALAFTLVRLDG